MPSAKEYDIVVSDAFVEEALDRLAASTNPAKMKAALIYTLVLARVDERRACVSLLESHGYVDAATYVDYNIRPGTP